MADQADTKEGTSAPATTPAPTVEDHESKFRGVLKEKTRLENELAALRAANDAAAKKAEEDKARAAGEIEKVLAARTAELEAANRKAALLEKKHALATAGFSGIIASGLLAEHESEAAAEPFGDWLKARAAAPDLVSILAGKPAQPPMVGGVPAPQGSVKRDPDAVFKEFEAALRSGKKDDADRLEAEFRRVSQPRP